MNVLIMQCVSGVRREICLLIAELCYCAVKLMCRGSIDICLCPRMCVCVCVWVGGCECAL
jgi:hypothetical protein